MQYLAFTAPDLIQIHDNVPLAGVHIAEGINEPDELTGTLPKALAYEGITVEGTDRQVALIRRYGTLIVAHEPGRAQAFLIDQDDEDGQSQDKLHIAGTGFGWIPKKVPWVTDRYDGVEVDPLAVLRRIWDHVTSFTETLTVQVDALDSPEKVGKEEQHNEGFTRSDGSVAEAFDHGPYRLNRWDTHDLQKQIDELAEETPFEWAERTTLNLDSEDPPTFRIQLGYPRIKPIIRHDHHFEIGYNVSEPQQPEDEDFFTDIYVFGNGSGPTKKWGNAQRANTGRHRAVKTISDTSLTTNGQCNQRARDEARRADREARFIESCRVLHTEAAPTGTYGKGDVIYLFGRTVWGDHGQWCRIVHLDRRMSDNSVQLTLARWTDQD